MPLLERSVLERKSESDAILRESYFASKTEIGPSFSDYQSVANLLSSETFASYHEDANRSRQGLPIGGIAMGLLGAFLGTGPSFAAGTSYDPPVAFEDLARAFPGTIEATSDSANVYWVEVRTGVPTSDLPLTVDTGRVLTIEQLSRGLEAAALEVPSETPLPRFNPDDYDLF